MNTSPFRKKFSSCSEYTLLNPLSFVRAETRGMLSTRANALNLRSASWDAHLLRSHAKCVAVEAEPQLPAMNTCAFLLQASTSRSVAALMEPRSILSITDFDSER